MRINSKPSKHNFFLLILLVLIPACNKSEIKKVKFDGFTIEVPRKWKKIKLKGTDSYVGGIVTEDKDSIIFDYGLYSNSLDINQPIKDSIFWDVLRLNEGIDPDKAFKIRDSLINIINVDSLNSHITEFKEIDNKKAKIIYPKKGIRGTTRIYLDSIWDRNINGSVRFNFYGNNLKIESRDALIKAFNTLKFEKS